MKYTTLSIPFVKRHDPSIDTNVRLRIERGYSAGEISAETGKSRITIYAYASDLSLKFKKRGQHHDKEPPRQDPNPPPEDPKTKGQAPEKMIKENITKKHVKDVSKKLATLTVEHELQMRKIVVALEKHTAIFESVEQMGMPREEFIDVAIEIGYKKVKDVYLKKVREQEEKKAMEEFLEIRKLINSMR